MFRTTLAVFTGGVCSLGLWWWQDPLQPQSSTADQAMTYVTHATPTPAPTPWLLEDEANYDLLLHLAWLLGEYDQEPIEEEDVAHVGPASQDEGQRSEEESRRVRLIATRGAAAQESAKQDEGEESQRLVDELRQLRSELAKVLGAEHPSLRSLDTKLVELHSRAIRANAMQRRGVVVQNQGPGGHRSFSVSPPGMLAELHPSAPPAEGANRGENVEMMVFGSQFPSGFTVPGVPGVPGVPAAAPPAYWSFGVVSGTGELGKKVAELRSQWKATEESVVEELREAVEEHFDADLQRRREQFADLEKRLAELGQQITKREEMREEVIQVLTRATEMEWEGIVGPAANSMNFYRTPGGGVTPWSGTAILPSRSRGPSTEGGGEKRGQR